MARRILVVDDSEASLRLSAARVAAAGWEVDTASGGTAAVEAARNGAYAMILMDLRMPDMDGARASEAIRSQRREPVPIIATTTLSREELASEFPDAHFEGYLGKPLDAAALAEILARLGPPASSGGDADSGAGFGSSNTSDSFGSSGMTPLAPDAVFDPAVIARVREDLGDDGFAQVVAVFAREVAGQLEEIPRALAAGDFASVQLGAHRLRGGAGTVGALRLARRAAQLENAASARDPIRSEALEGSLGPLAREVADAVQQLRGGA